MHGFILQCQHDGLMTAAKTCRLVLCTVLGAAVCLLSAAEISLAAPVSRTPVLTLTCFSVIYVAFTDASFPNKRGVNPCCSFMGQVAVADLGLTPNFKC